MFNEVQVFALGFVLKASLLFLISVVLLSPWCLLFAYGAVRLFGETIRRLALWRGRHYLSFDYQGTEVQIGWNLWGETKIWDCEIRGISRKKLYAIYFGGPTGMMIVSLGLIGWAWLVGFSWNRALTEIAYLFLGSLIVTSLFFSIGAIILHLSIIKEEIERLCK